MKKTTKKKVEKTTIKKSEAAQLKSIAKKVAEDHKGDPKPQLLFKKDAKPTVEKKTRFHIWDVYGVKFIVDNGVPTRRVTYIDVGSDHDTANEPDVRNRLITEAEDKLMSQGYFMTDVDAMEAALKELEPALDNLRHDIKYEGVCQGCAADRLGKALDWLEYLRSWRNRRFALADALGGTHNLPPVIPNDYQENWHIDHEHHRLVKNVETPKEIRSYKIENIKNAKELADALAQIDLPKETVAKLSNAIGQIVGQSEKLKALPLPAKK